MENKIEANGHCQDVQYLDYKRMGRCCLKAVAQIPNVGSSLIFLDLSGSRLGDKGVCSLAKILRINRTIRAISLSNNRLSDVGVEALCEVITAFTLTGEEVAMRRLLRMKMILDDPDFLDLVKSRLSFENDAPTLSRKETGVARKHQNLKKGVSQKTKVEEKKNSELQERIPEEMKQISALSPKQVGDSSNHPLLAKEEEAGPFGVRIRGNYQLAMLNLSRNSITDFGVGLLTRALSIQTASIIGGNFTGGMGLTDILLKANEFDEAGTFHENLLIELQRKRDLIGVQS